MSKNRREQMPTDKVYETLSEIKERTASVETKVDIMLENNKKVDEIKDIAVKARNSASSSHKRIDKIDKWMFAIGSTLILGIIGMVLSLISVAH